MRKLLCIFLLLSNSLHCLSEEQSLADLFESVKSSVVVVYTVEYDAQKDDKGNLVSLPSLGSGVLVDDQGHIVTAAHVVQTADKVRVAFVGDRRFDAKIISSDVINDVALLKIEEIPNDVTPIVLADSDKVRVGDRAFIVGAPYGLDYSLSAGYISSRHKDGIKNNPSIRTELFQTDAAINTGNSGGPMFNMQGEIIGIVSSLLSKSGGFEGLGFIVTSNAAKEVLFNRRPTWTGLQGVLITGDLAKGLNVPQKHGYLVQKVASGSPADELGIEAGNIMIKIQGVSLLIGGDIILGVDNIYVSSETPSAIQEHLDSMKPGQEYTVSILRSGSVIRLNAQAR
jgi:serine protease Do